MILTLTYSQVLDAVTRQLSVIAKRLTDSNGNSLYESVTLGSNEFPAINDYVREAAADMGLIMKDFLVERTEDDDAVSIVYNPPASGLHSSLIDTAALNYASAYALQRCLELSSAPHTENVAAHTLNARNVFTNLILNTRSHHADFSLNSANES